MDLKSRIKDYINNKIIFEYKEYISDKTHTLDDRWEVFCIAPYFWQIHTPYIEQFDVFGKLEKFSWSHDYNYEINETVDLFAFVHFVQENLNTRFNKFGWTQEIIDEFKEEILQRNLASFSNRE